MTEVPVLPKSAEHWLSADSVWAWLEITTVIAKASTTNNSSRIKMGF